MDIALPPKIAELEQQTGIDYGSLNILRNPLLPYGLQESKELVENHNKLSQVSVFTMCENVQTLPQKVFKDIYKLDNNNNNTTIGIDIAKLNSQNAKELKAL